jgi:hypothetical protein
MEELEWRMLVSFINADIAGIVRTQRIDAIRRRHARRVLDELRKELAEREKRPKEEDFITADAFGIEPVKPIVRRIDGVRVQTRMLHRKGLTETDIKGADLLYEVAGVKFALVQYKTPNRQGRVARDREQLDELIGACPNSNLNLCPPHVSSLDATCGAWFAVRSEAESGYLPACLAQDIFGDTESRKKEEFLSPHSRYSYKQFERAFARCFTGARVGRPRFNEYRMRIERDLIKRDWVLIYASQSGSFRTKR